MTDILLIYPTLGNMDLFVVDLPLSVLYAASASVKAGHRVRILDLRVEDQDWRKVLRPILEEGVKIVGISVMTGFPLANAREISNHVKTHYPDTKILWGGPHATILPNTIEEPFIDYLIRGYGSQSLATLLDVIDDGPEALPTVPGLSFKQASCAVHNDRSNCHEMIPYEDIPYHLINVSSPKYGRSYDGSRFFSLFSAIGCPYKCNFCVHPAIYRVINGAKWKAYPEDDVIGHITMAHERYGATHICFLDDTSFVDIKRMRSLFERIASLDFKLTLEFRGARVNEIEKMDDEFIDLMVKAGTRIIMVGFESASDNVLRRMNKDARNKKMHY